MQENLVTLRRTAAEIAAAAVYELYPEVELLGGSETDTGFSYDFIFPYPVHSHLIEEKMKQIVRDKRLIRTLEMVPFSASELLKSKGLFARAEKVGVGGLVEVVQIGDFCDLSLGPHLKNTAELAAFKIFAEACGEKEMRISGFCHWSKEELKKYLKQVENYTDPHFLGEKKGFWKGPVWLSAGLILRERLIQFLKREWFEGALEISGPLCADRFEFHRTLGARKVAEIWALTPNDTHLQISFLGQPEGKIISSLHLIGKTLTILGFDHSTIPMGSGIAFMVMDGLGRSQLLVHVEKRGVDFCFFAEVEKIFFQMLEKNLIGLLENQ